jgi:hypothetical protein
MKDCRFGAKNDVNEDPRRGLGLFWFSLFRTFSAPYRLYVYLSLGRWPRLLHSAPLGLSNMIFLHSWLRLTAELGLRGES